VFIVNNRSNSKLKVIKRIKIQQKKNKIISLKIKKKKECLKEVQLIKLGKKYQLLQWLMSLIIISDILLGL